jgi:glutamate formiminotransferase / formiminotetrahydrofolate cyclodeaminase
MDICPFVLVANGTMEECMAVSKGFGRRAAEEISIPIYLYEESATQDYRKKLPQIRKGQYEAVKDIVVTKG